MEKGKDAANHLKLASLGLIAAVFSAAAPAPKPPADPQVAADGVVRVPSVYPMEETINRLKQEIASKGITFFTAMDQSKLAADAGIGTASIDTAGFRQSRAKAPSLSHRRRWRASTGQCGFWFTKSKLQKSGPPIRDIHVDSAAAPYHGS